MKALTAVRNAVTSRAGRQVLKLRKNSPALLFGAGVVGVVATAVLASRATLKLDKILEETQKDLMTIDAMEHPGYTPQDRQKDKALVFVKAGVSIAKIYALPAAVGVLSVGALTGSHVVLSRRNMAVTAAYAALDRGFKEYRQRVVDTYGEDEERKLRYDLAGETQLTTETEKGQKTQNVQLLKSKHGSIYARIFDQLNPNWQKQAHYNQFFISSQQNYANDKLRAQGHLFLNEVYDMLGLERSKEGAVVGWVMGGGGDDFVDFGVFRNNVYMGQEFVEGHERSIHLDFNVDGIIYDKI